MSRSNMSRSPKSSQIDQNNQRYNTPSRTNKFVTLSHPVCSYILTDKMKPVRASISIAMDKRFTLKEQKDGAQIVRKSQMVRVSPKITNMTAVRQPKENLTLDNIQQLCRVFSLDIEQKVKGNQRYKEKLLKKINDIKKKREKLRNFKKSMTLIEYKRKRFGLVRDYYEYLVQEKSKSKAICENLEWEIGLKQVRANSLATDINIQLQKMTQLRIQTREKSIFAQENNEMIHLLSKKMAELSKKEIPEEKELIRAMFLVGILNQQIEIFSQVQINNKGKISKKTCPPVRNANITQCHGYIGNFRVFTYIYMFSQSLLLPNIKAVLQTTPFFAEEEKELYNYPLYQRKMELMVHHLKSSEVVSKIKNSQFRASKTLHLCTEANEISRMREILVVLSRISENDYRLGRVCIRLQSMTSSDFPEFSRQILQTEDSCLFLSVEWMEK